MADFVLDGYTLAYPSPPTNGLLIYLDTSGKENDDAHRDYLLNMNSPQTHTGANLENVAYDFTSGYLTSSGIHLDGIDDYLYGYLPSMLTAVTIESTLRLTDPKKQILLQVGDETENWALRYNLGFLELLHNSSVLATATINLTNTLASKACMALLVTPTTARIYINAVEVLNTAIVLPVLGDENDYFCIGSGFPSKGYMEGNFYSFRLYNRVLTQTELTKNFKADKKRWSVKL